MLGERWWYYPVSLALGVAVFLVLFGVLNLIPMRTSVAEADVMLTAADEASPQEQGSAEKEPERPESAEETTEPAEEEPQQQQPPEDTTKPEEEETEQQEPPEETTKPDKEEPQQQESPKETTKPDKEELQEPVPSLEGEAVSSDAAEVASATPPEAIQIELSSDASKPQEVRIDELPALFSEYAKGTFPKLAYRGDTKALFERYPRLEGAIVYEEGGSESNVAKYRWVYDPNIDSQPQFRSGKIAFGFYSSMMRQYVHEAFIIKRRDVVAIDEFEASMLLMAGLGPEDASRIQWGEIRHRGEAMALAPVFESYRKYANAHPEEAEKDGNILVVTWGATGGEPLVKSIELWPEGTATERVEIPN